MSIRRLLPRKRPDLLLINKRRVVAGGGGPVTHQAQANLSTRLSISNTSLLRSLPTSISLSTRVYVQSSNTRLTSLTSSFATRLSLYSSGSRASSIITTIRGNLSTFPSVSRSISNSSYFNSNLSISYSLTRSITNSVNLPARLSSSSNITRLSACILNLANDLSCRVSSVNRAISNFSNFHGNLNTIPSLNRSLINSLTLYAHLSLSSNDTKLSSLNANLANDLSCAFVPTRSGTLSLALPLDGGLTVPISTLRIINSSFANDGSVQPRAVGSFILGIGILGNAYLFGDITSSSGGVVDIAGSLAGNTSVIATLSRLSPLSNSFSGKGVVLFNVSKANSTNANFSCDSFYSSLLSNSRSVSIQLLSNGAVEPNLRRSASINAEYSGRLVYTANIAKIMCGTSSFSLRCSLRSNMTASNYITVGLNGRTVLFGDLTSSGGMVLIDSVLASRGSLSSSLTRNLSLNSFSNLDLSCNTTVVKNSNSPIVLAGNLSTRNVITNASRLYLNLGGNLYLLGTLDGEVFLPSLVSHYEYSLLVSRNREYRLQK